MTKPIRRVLYRWRSSITGRWLRADEASTASESTQRETVKPRDPRPTLADLEDTEHGVHHPPEE